MMLPDPVGLIGMTKEVVINMLAQTKIRYRIVKEDDRVFGLTMDYIEDRANLTVKDNIVTDIYMG